MRSKACALLLLAALCAVSRAAESNGGPQANATTPGTSTTPVATNTTAVNATAPAAGTEDRKRDGWRGTGSWGQWDDSDTDGSDPTNCARHKSDGSWDTSGCEGDGSSNGGDGNGGSDPTNCAKRRGDGSWDHSGCDGGDWSGDDGSGDDGSGDDGSGGGDWSGDDGSGDDGSGGDGSGDDGSGDGGSGDDGSGDDGSGDDGSTGGEGDGSTDPVVPSPPTDPAVPDTPSPPTDTPSPPNPTDPPTPGTAGDCPDIQAALDAHNAARTARGAAALVWNDTLATYAQGVSQTCKFEHSNGPYGENLAMGTANCKDAVDLWVAEQSLYDPAQGFDANTGHFTQVVWKATTQVGCGFACNIVTCSYDPAGNVEGEFVTNV